MKVIYSERFFRYLMPKFAGYTLGPVVLIRKSKEEDVVLQMHEAVHVPPVEGVPVKMWLRYWRDKQYRLVRR